MSTFKVIEQLKFKLGVSLNGLLLLIFILAAVYFGYERYVLNKAGQQVLGPVPTDITIVTKPKVQEVTDKCPGSNKILPIRLFIDKENKIIAYGSEITEPYLAASFKSLPYGCEDARITFLYEKGASLKYIEKLNALLTNSEKYGHEAPILLEIPTENVIWNWQNSSNRVRVSGTSIEPYINRSIINLLED